mmetsp:Transcript_85937/g.270896  ORF Transcript_85937/g.270896 Transcript_85937/m.270896 type:complete len:216 (+) Transcript_85937:1118-1765(+)
MSATALSSFRCSSSMASRRDVSLDSRFFTSVPSWRVAAFWSHSDPVCKARSSASLCSMPWKRNSCWACLSSSCATVLRRVSSSATALKASADCAAPSASAVTPSCIACMAPSIRKESEATAWSRCTSRPRTAASRASSSASMRRAMALHVAAGKAPSLAAQPQPPATISRGPGLRPRRTAGASSSSVNSASMARHMRTSRFAAKASEDWKPSEPA